MIKRNVNLTKLHMTNNHDYVDHGHMEDNFKDGYFISAEQAARILQLAIEIRGETEGVDDKMWEHQDECLQAEEIISILEGKTNG